MRAFTVNLALVSVTLCQTTFLEVWKRNMEKMSFYDESKKKVDFTVTQQYHGYKNYEKGDLLPEAAIKKK